MESEMAASGRTAPLGHKRVSWNVRFQADEMSLGKLRFGLTASGGRIHFSE
jgi:hypothetical protein